MFDNMTDTDLLALEYLAKKEAKARGARGTLTTGDYSGTLLGCEYALTVGEDTTTSGSDPLVMTRLALVLLDRLETRLKGQGKALNVEAMLEKAQGTEPKVHSIAGRLEASRKAYLSNLPRKERKGTLKAVAV